MDYWFEKSQAANTAEADAEETIMELVPGVITHVSLTHPPGCHGLAHAVIVEGIHQLWPTNPEGSYHGDTYPMEFDEGYELKSPAELKLITWNEDDTYAHSVFVRITILPKWYAMPYLIIRDFVNIIKKLIGI